MRKKTRPHVIQLAVDHFGALEDPRIDRTKHHPLINIVVMSLSGAICGADGWDDLADFARARKRWFKRFLDLPKGTPSADTFRRVLCVLNPVRFEELFRRWMSALATSLQGEVVALDGKSIRGAIDRAGSTTPLHLLHAFATRQSLLLAQRAVAGAPGEVAAIPELLRLIDVRGATVTTDANGCTAATTRSVREAGADFLLAIKGNRGKQHKFVVAQFKDAEAKKYRGVLVSRRTDRKHGRVEKRVVRAIPLKTWPSKDTNWTDVNTAVQIDRTRIVDGVESTERHFYITSHPADTALIANAARAHWGVENGLHWKLDVGFNEDGRLIRDKNGAQNFALISRLALLQLQRETSLKRGIAGKRKNAAWDNDYLLRVLASEILEV